MREDELWKVRGTGMNMVFQESLISLNPVYRVESQIGESIDVAEKTMSKELSKEEKRASMLNVLKESV